MNPPAPAGDDAATIAAELSASFSAVMASAFILLVVTAFVAILPSTIAPVAMVVAKLPVPVPVTSPVSVMVWSPVLVPLLVPLKLPPSAQVPLPVEMVPRPSVARCAAAFASSSNARPAAVQAISSTLPAPALVRPSKRSVALTFWSLS